MCVGKMCTARGRHENRRVSEGRLNKAVGMICRLLTRTCRLVLGWGSKNRDLLVFIAAYHWMRCNPRCARQAHHPVRLYIFFMAH